ncbi:MAG: hypothetical protein AAF191_18250, partial [Verrucomicrobiota bacterium]
DGEEFLLVLCLVYLSDCLFWAPRHAVALRSWLLRGWSLARPKAWAGNQSGGYSLASPLPPLGHFFLCEPLPLALSEEGISSPNLENPNPGPLILRPRWFLPWTQVESIARDGRAIILNGRLKCWVSSPAASHRLLHFLRTLHESAPEERQSLIEREHRRSLASHSVSRRLLIYRKRIRFLRVATNLLFFLLFLALPFTYLQFGGTSAPLIVLLALIWTIMLQIAWEGFRLHRRWYPALKTERWQLVISSLLLPPNAIRLLDELSKGYLAGFHPLAVARADLPGADLPLSANTILRDLQYPIPHPTGEQAETASWEHGKTVHDLRWSSTLNESPPVPEEAPLGKHCPRCFTPYENHAEACQDCGGLALVGESPE